MTARITRMAQAVRLLEKQGFLLLSDSVWPSLVTRMVGEPVRGSWWGHELGHAIYNLASELEDHPDVLAVKLIGGKVTFVHARCWPDLLAVVSQGAAWQIRGLSDRELLLWRAVEKASSLRLDQLPKALGAKLPKPKPVAAKLCDRLLVFGESIHTETGAHATQLNAWSAWASAKGVSPAKDAEAAKQRLEGLVSAWDRPETGKGRRLFPWPA